MNPAERLQTNAAEALLASWMEKLLEDRRAGRDVDWETLTAQHPALAAELRSLWPVLVSLDEGSPPAKHDAAVSPPETPGQAVGDFRIVRLIGRGGMGVVYLAEQLSLQRTVALKVLPLAGCLDDQQLKRFKNEARAASTFHHPNIVPVYSVGEDRGVHYFAMKYVPGCDLAKVVAQLRDARNSHSSCPVVERDGSVPPRESNPESDNDADDTAKCVWTSREELDTLHPARSEEYFRWTARLAVQAARALQHAHDEGVVHRDIKPANLIVQAPEHLWVTDFGLALRPSAEALTLTGNVPGTIRYMSPEQAAGRTVDFRTDIYSLGVTLYELLTLRPAFDSHQNDKLLRAVMEAEPPDPRTFEPAVPEPLERIVLKAMRKEPEERYATATELAADLERFLAAQPVLARRVTRWERTLRWLRRRPRTLLTLLAACALSAVCFAAVSLLLTKAYRAESLAHSKANAATAATRDHLKLLQREVFNHQLARAATAAERNADDALALLWDETRCPPELRDFTWGLLNRRCRLRGDVIASDEKGLLSVALSPDEALVAVGGKGNSVLLTNAATEERVATLVGHTDWVTGVAFLPDGRSLASSSRDGTVRIWDVMSCEAVATLRPENGRIESMAVSPDGTQLATGGSDGTISLWNAADWTRSASITYSHDAVFALCFSHDGERLASGSLNSWVRLMRASDGAPLASQHVASFGAGGLRAHTVCFSRDDSTLFIAATGHHRFALDGDSLSIRNSRLASWIAWDVCCLSESRLVAACDDGIIRMVDTETDVASEVLVGHRGAVRSLCLTTDAGVVYSAGEDGTLRRWRTDFGLYEASSRSGIPGSPCVTLSPSGKVLAVAGEDGALQIYEAGTLRRIASWTGHQATINALAFTPAESLLVSVAKDAAKAWDWREARLVSLIFESTTWLEAVAFAPDGQSLYVSGRDGNIRRFRARDWKLDRTWAGHTDRVWGLAVSPDGHWLASASRDRTFRLWDVAAGKTVWSHPYVEPVGAVAFSPDGRTLAVATSRFAHHASFQGEIEFWNVNTRKSRTVLRGHGDEVHGIAFSPDGKSFASTSADRTVRLWDARSGQERSVVGRHQDWVYGVAFAPDSRSMFTVDKDQSLFAWRADDLQPSLLRSNVSRTPNARTLPGDVNAAVIATLQPGTRTCTQVALSDDGQLLAASDMDRTTTVWNTADWSVRSQVQLADIDPAVDLAFSPDSSWLAITCGPRPTRLWNLQTGQIIVVEKSVGCGGGVAYSRRGRYFASTNYLAHLQVFDIRRQAQVPLEALATRLEAEGDRFLSSRMAGIDNRTRSAVIWDLNSAKPTISVHDLPEIVGQAIIPRHGTTCVLSISNFDDQLMSIDTVTGVVQRRFGNHTLFPGPIAASDDGQLLLSRGADEQFASLWDLPSGELLTTLRHLAGVACVTLSRDGRTAVCGFSDGKVRVWRIDRGRSNRTSFD